MPKEPKTKKAKAPTRTQTYICRCTQKCGGIPRTLSKRTYQQHTIFSQLEVENQRESEDVSIVDYFKDVQMLIIKYNSGNA